MFFNLGPLEIAVLVIVALVVFGPDRLPTLARDAARMIRTLRELAQGARTQLRDELGPELGNLDLASLNPRTALRRALLDDDDDPPPGYAAGPDARRGTGHPPARGDPAAGPRRGSPVRRRRHLANRSHIWTPPETGRTSGRRGPIRAPAGGSAGGGGQAEGAAEQAALPARQRVRDLVQRPSGG